MMNIVPPLLSQVTYATATGLLADSYSRSAAENGKMRNGQPSTVKTLTQLLSYNMLVMPSRVFYAKSGCFLSDFGSPPSLYIEPDTVKPIYKVSYNSSSLPAQVINLHTD